LALVEPGSTEIRDAQFRYINAKVCEFTQAGEPVVSVDTHATGTLRRSPWSPCAAGGSREGELADFIHAAGLEVMVCHFPPGTSKCNKIEHRTSGTAPGTTASDPTAWPRTPGAVNGGIELPSLNSVEFSEGSGGAMQERAARGWAPE